MLRRSTCSAGRYFSGVHPHLRTTTMASFENQQQAKQDAAAQRTSAFDPDNSRKWTFGVEGNELKPALHAQQQQQQPLTAEELTQRKRERDMRRGFTVETGDGLPPTFVRMAGGVTGKRLETAFDKLSVGVPARRVGNESEEESVEEDPIWQRNQARPIVSTLKNEQQAFTMTTSSGAGAAASQPLEPIGLPPLKSYRPPSSSSSSSRYSQQQHQLLTEQQPAAEFDPNENVVYDADRDEYRVADPRFEQQDHHHHQDGDQHQQQRPPPPLDPRIELLKQFSDTRVEVTNDLVVELSREIVEDELRQKEDQQNQQQHDSILQRIRRTSRIATQRGCWTGALGLVTAVRVAAFVPVDEDGTALHSVLRPEQLSQFEAVQFVSALALSQAMTRACLTGNRRQQRTTTDDDHGTDQQEQQQVQEPEPFDAISVAQRVANFALASDISLQPGSGEGEEEQQLSRLKHASALSTNHIVASGIALIERSQQQRQKQQQQNLSTATDASSTSWQAAMQLLGGLNLHKAPASASVAAVAAPPPPQIIRDAIPLAFSSCARVLRAAGKWDSALHLLNSVYFGGVRDRPRASESAWTQCPAPAHVFCRLLASNAPLASHWSQALQAASELLAFNLETTKDNNSQLRIIPQSLHRNLGSYATALGSVRTLLVRAEQEQPQQHPSPLFAFTKLQDEEGKGEELCRFVVAALKKSPFVSSSEAVECAAGILSRCDAAAGALTDHVLNVMTATPAAQQTPTNPTAAEDDEQDILEEQQGEEEQQPELTPYQQLLADSGNLLHPLIIGSLMQSCVRTGNWQKALLLYDSDALALPCSAQVAATIPPHLLDRRIDNSAVNSLAALIAHRSSSNSSSRDQSISGENKTDAEVLTERFQIVRHSLLSSLKKTLRQHSSSRSSSSSSSSFFDAAATARNLSIFAPSLHERGVAECNAAYLAALGASRPKSTTPTALSSSSLLRETLSRNSTKSLRESKNPASTGIVFTSTSVSLTQSRGEQQQQQPNDPVVNAALSLFPPQHWRPRHLSQLIQLLFNRGAHHKISLVFRNIHDECNKCADEIAESLALMDNNNDAQETENIGDQQTLPLDPAQMDFVTWKRSATTGTGSGGNNNLSRKHHHQQQRNEKRAIRDAQFVESRRSWRLNSLLSGNAVFFSGSRSAAQSLLPLPMDARSLSLCVRSMCEVGNWKLAVAAADEMTSVAALSSSASFKQQDVEEQQETAVALEAVRSLVARLQEDEKNAAVQDQQQRSTSQQQLRRERLKRLK